jgi:hypothetical protein
MNISQILDKIDEHQLFVPGIEYYQPIWHG